MPDYKEQDYGWRNDAACVGSNPDLFFPVGETTGPAIEQIEQAKAICRNCAAKVACLEFALDTRQEHGIWGGTTEGERRSILRGEVIIRGADDEAV